MNEQNLTGTIQRPNGRKPRKARKPRAVTVKADAPAPATASHSPATPSKSGTEYTCRLQPRHAQWLQYTAAGLGRSVENTLEWLVRQAYAADPEKAGQTPGGVGSSVQGKFTG